MWWIGSEGIELVATGRDRSGGRRCRGAKFYPSASQSFQRLGRLFLQLWGRRRSAAQGAISGANSMISKASGAISGPSPACRFQRTRALLRCARFSTPSACKMLIFHPCFWHTEPFWHRSSIFARKCQFWSIALTNRETDTPTRFSPPQPEAAEAEHSGHEQRPCAGLGDGTCRYGAGHGLRILVVVKPGALSAKLKSSSTVPQSSSMRYSPPCRWPLRTQIAFRLTLPRAARLFSARLGSRQSQWQRIRPTSSSRSRAPGRP